MAAVAGIGFSSGMTALLVVAIVQAMSPPPAWRVSDEGAFFLVLRFLYGGDLLRGGEQIDEAIDRLRSGKAHYRIVLRR